MLINVLSDLQSNIVLRGSIALLSAFIVSLILMPHLINFLSTWQRVSKNIRVGVPDTHLKKINTPIMGGVMIVFSSLLSILLWSHLNNICVWLIIIIMLGYTAIGFADDYTKINRKSRGISGYLRLSLEAVFALIFVLIVHNVQGGSAYFLSIPLWYMLDISYLMIPLAVIVIVGTANAVNLTDGLDGLAIFPVMIVIGCLATINLIIGYNNSSLHVTEELTEMTVICGALFGAAVGFLWFNAPPAKIFMGDTGSLALGATLGGLSIILKQEIILAIVGGVFVIETISVIVQVLSYRFCGKRVFHTAPLHHHFEKQGLSETIIVVRFWIISILLAILILTIIIA